MHLDVGIYRPSWSINLSYVSYPFSHNCQILKVLYAITIALNTVYSSSKIRLTSKCSSIFIYSGRTFLVLFQSHVALLSYGNCQTVLS